MQKTVTIPMTFLHDFISNHCSTYNLCSHCHKSFIHSRTCFVDSFCWMNFLSLTHLYTNIHKHEHTHTSRLSTDNKLYTNNLTASACFLACETLCTWQSIHNAYDEDTCHFISRYITSIHIHCIILHLNPHTLCTASQVRNVKHSHFLSEA